MTTNEQDAQIGRVVREHAEAVRHLACVDSRLDSVKASLRELSGTLGDDELSLTAYEDGFTVTSRADSLQRIEYPDRDSILALLGERSTLRRRVRELEDRRRSFGL